MVAAGTGVVGDAVPLLPPERVLATKAGRENALLKGVVDGHLGLHGDLEAEDETSPDLRHEENF